MPSRGPKSKRSPNQSGSNEVPTVFQEMLREAGGSPVNVPDEPLGKRRKLVSKKEHLPTAPPVPQPPPQDQPPTQSSHDDDDDDDDDDPLADDLPETSAPQQTVFNDSDSSEDSDAGWEEFLSETKSIEAEEPKELDHDKRAIAVDFAKQKPSIPRRKRDQRPPDTKAERQKRLDVHKAHICCMLSHGHAVNMICCDQDLQQVGPRLKRVADSYSYPLGPTEATSEKGCDEALEA